MDYRRLLQCVIVAIALGHIDFAHAIDVEQLDRHVGDRRYDRIVADLATIPLTDPTAIAWLEKYENGWHPPLLSQLSVRLFETKIKENQVRAVLIWAKARFSFGFDRQACAKSTREIADWTERFALEGLQQEFVTKVEPRALVVAGKRAINWAASIGTFPRATWLCGEANFKEAQSGLFDQLSYARQFQDHLKDVESKLKPAS